MYLEGKGITLRYLTRPVRRAVFANQQFDRRPRFLHDHALDAPRGDFHDLAVRKAKDAGLALVRELDEPELMRKETWLLGEGSAVPPSKVLVRVSTHGTDHLLEVFVASDDAASVVGLLGHLSMELLDSVRSGMPGAAFDRLRDPRMLSDLEVWPTLLEYAVEGD